MTKKQIKRGAALLHGLFVVLFVALFAVNSCTYDYFDDETNFRLYVPQIHAALFDQGGVGSDAPAIDDREIEAIDRLLVTFHTMDGKHVLTRELEAPFDARYFIEPGVLRFKLPPGQYRITCWANYTPGMVTEGEMLSSSYKGVGAYDPDRFMYGVSPSNPRVLFLDDVKVWPLGAVETMTPVTANIDERCEFKSQVICAFEGLPQTAYYTRIETVYKGPATRLGFDGAFSRFNDADIHFHDLSTGGMAFGDYSYSNLIYPSTQTRFDPNAEPWRGGGEDIELEIRLYIGEMLSGELTVTRDDLTRLDPEDRPVDGDDNPMTDLVLYPRSTIKFTFDDFMLVGVRLTPWGDIETGVIELN
ncbi:MAG: hypothetical protein LBV18_02325 [Alistipes sp.]|jgi:hypothetical protein|nr:hypothetical protein [Alistipes sp.]